MCSDGMSECQGYKIQQLPEPVCNKEDGNRSVNFEGSITLQVELSRQFDPVTIKFVERLSMQILSGCN